MSVATYAHLLDQVRGLRADLSRPPVVGISGHGGAGKTTLARRLAADLGVRPEQVVTLDRLYAAGATEQGGLFDLHDWEVLLALLRAVRTAPTPARLAHPTRQWSGESGVHDVAMPSVVLVEGIRLLRAETMPLLDLAVWIDLDPEAAGERAVARNVAQGDGLEELALWRSRWVPEARAYEQRVRPAALAHVVIGAAGRV